jgi:hypothetical protein
MKEEWTTSAPNIDWDRVWDIVQTHGPVVVDTAVAIGLVMIIYVLVEKGLKRLHRWRLKRGRDATLLASLKQANGGCLGDGSSQTSSTTPSKTPS